jgi:hypothetical protein
MAPRYTQRMQVMVSPEQYAWLERLAKSADVNLATVVRHLCAIRMYPVDDPSGFVELMQSLREEFEYDRELEIIEHEVRGDLYQDFTL